MIGYLHGNVIKTRGKKLLLDVGGVGYEIGVNAKIILHAKVDETKKLWIHTHQTSDAISLYGFEEEKELEFFELLMKVNGVGPKSALEILENPLETLEKIILEGDLDALSQTQGIGKKTAARIILELKAKMKGGDVEIPEEGEVNEEALEAITSLGYAKKDARKILRKLPKEIEKSEEIVKWFLKNA
jgi:Holliday junction DNA helicase RuvA